MEQHNERLGHDEAADLAQRLSFAEQLRVRYPINEQLYPDPLDRWWHWYEREQVAAMRGWALQLCQKFRKVAAALFDCINIRDFAAVGEPIRYEQIAEAVWAANRALDDVEAVIPEIMPPGQHADLRAALNALLESLPPAPPKKPRRTRKQRPEA